MTVYVFINVQFFSCSPARHGKGTVPYVTDPVSLVSVHDMIQPPKATPCHQGHPGSDVPALENAETNVRKKQKRQSGLRRTNGQNETDNESVLSKLASLL
ncbi:hypothetical protein LSAT2_032092 [Lamellibrachia satsuma]|nr:hypothetical protein LSAT2_032092 [Lamellibrachia satsuma]